MAWWMLFPFSESQFSYLEHLTVNPFLFKSIQMIRKQQLNFVEGVRRPGFANSMHTSLDPWNKPMT